MVGYHGGSFYHRGKRISDSQNYDRIMEFNEAKSIREQRQIYDEMETHGLKFRQRDHEARDGTVFEKMRAKYPNQSRLIDGYAYAANRDDGTFYTSISDFSQLQRAQMAKILSNPVVKRARERVYSRKKNRG
jgi:hypothetical protein